jgi:hypothetical protein
MWARRLMFGLVAVLAVFGSGCWSCGRCCGGPSTIANRPCCPGGPGGAVVPAPATSGFSPGYISTVPPG